MTGLLDSIEQSHPGLLGKLSQTWPARMAQGLLGAVTLPGDVYQGKVSIYGPDGHTNPEVINRSADLSGFAMGGAMPAAERGAVGIFGGRLAATADQAKLLQAEQMFRKGSGPNKILEETGWFRGADGKWRFEIDDSASKLNFDKALPSKAESGVLADHLSHPELFAAYPELGQVRSTVASGANAGRYFPPQMLDEAAIQTTATNPATGRSVALHEVQHAIQELENFSKGSMAKGNSAEYAASSGENEARNVQRRLFMTPEERRSIPPWETDPIPYRNQSVNFGYK